MNSIPKIFLQNPYIKKQVTTIQSEIISITSACNCQIQTDKILSKSSLKKPKRPFIPSMKQDYQNKKPLEIDAVLGNPLKFAQKLGVKTPCLTTIYQQLKFINAQNIQSVKNKKNDTNYE